MQSDVKPNWISCRSWPFRSLAVAEFCTNRFEPTHRWLTGIFGDDYSRRGPRALDLAEVSAVDNPLFVVRRQAPPMVFLVRFEPSRLSKDGTGHKGTMPR
jgi:hypothetical protein